MSTFTLSDYQRLIDTINTPVANLVETKGEPLLQTTEQDAIFYWYESQVPTKAEIYRLDDDKVVWTSIDVKKQNIILDQVVQVLGSPTISIQRYESKDSIQSHIASWPEKGITVILSGDNVYAKVLKIEFFKSQTKTEYLSNLGEKFKDKQVVNLIVTPTPIITETVSLPKYIYLNTYITSDVGSIAFVFFTITFVICIILLQRHFSKK